MTTPIVIHTPDAVLTVHTHAERDLIVEALAHAGVAHTVHPPTPKEI